MCFSLPTHPSSGEMRLASENEVGAVVQIIETSIP
jgi:hypothetical protein